MVRTPSRKGSGRIDARRPQSVNHAGKKRHWKGDALRGVSPQREAGRAPVRRIENGQSANSGLGGGKKLASGRHG
jgi:hypothetical protein